MLSLVVEDDGVGYDAPTQLEGTVPNGIGLRYKGLPLDLKGKRRCHQRAYPAGESNPR
jgi:hypothetical protein